MVQLQKVAVLVYYHIDLRRRGLVIQLQGKGDLPLSRAAHAPAAGHAAHLQNGLLPAQHPGKGRVDLIAHGGKVGQRRGLVRQVGVVLVALRDILHPGIPDPLGVLQHKTVSLLQTGRQRDAYHHGAVAAHPQMQLLYLFAHQLVLNALHAAQLGARLCRHLRPCSASGGQGAAAPAPRRQTAARSR